MSGRTSRPSLEALISSNLFIRASVIDVSSWNPGCSGCDCFGLGLQGRENWHGRGRSARPGRLRGGGQQTLERGGEPVEAADEQGATDDIADGDGHEVLDVACPGDRIAVRLEEWDGEQRHIGDTVLP